MQARLLFAWREEREGPSALSWIRSRLNYRHSLWKSGLRTIYRLHGEGWVHLAFAMGAGAVGVELRSVEDPAAPAEERRR